MEKKVPMRTCIVCKAVKPKKELARIVKNGSEITFDRTGKANGRGAYICDDPACLEKLIKTKALNRVFSCQVDDGVYAAIREAFRGEEK